MLSVILICVLAELGFICACLIPGLLLKYPSRRTPAGVLALTYFSLAISWISFAILPLDIIHVPTITSILKPNRTLLQTTTRL